MEALGDALRPSMLGPSSGSGKESMKKTVWTQMELWQRFGCGPLELQPGAARPLRPRRDLLLKARKEATCAG